MPLETSKVTTTSVKTMTPNEALLVIARRIAQKAAEAKYLYPRLTLPKGHKNSKARAKTMAKRAQEQLLHIEQILAQPEDVLPPFENDRQNDIDAAIPDLHRVAVDVGKVWTDVWFMANEVASDNPRVQEFIYEARELARKEIMQMEMLCCESVRIMRAVPDASEAVSRTFLRNWRTRVRSWCRQNGWSENWLSPAAAIVLLESEGINELLQRFHDVEREHVIYEEEPTIVQHDNEPSSPDGLFNSEMPRSSLFGKWCRWRGWDSERVAAAAFLRVMENDVVRQRLRECLDREHDAILGQLRTAFQKEIDDKFHKMAEVKEEENGNTYADIVLKEASAPAGQFGRECPSCKTLPGDLHWRGCEIEICPRCGNTFNLVAHPEFCDDDVPDSERIAWTGERPGVAECREFGFFVQRNRDGPGWIACGPNEPAAVPNLERLHEEATWDPEQKRFVKK